MRSSNLPVAPFLLTSFSDERSKAPRRLPLKIQQDTLYRIAVFLKDWRFLRWSNIPHRSRYAAPQPEQIVSLCLLVPLFYLTVGHAAGLPLPAALDQGAGMLVLALIQLALTLSVCWLNRAVLQKRPAGALRLRPGRCLTPALGAAVALVWGLVALVQLIARAGGGHPRCRACPPAASVSGRRGRSLADRRRHPLAGQAAGPGGGGSAPPFGCLPRTATVARDGKAVRVSADTLQPGTSFWSGRGRASGGRRGAGGQLLRGGGSPHRRGHPGEPRPSATMSSAGTPQPDFRPGLPGRAGGRRGQSCPGGAACPAYRLAWRVAAPHSRPVLRPADAGGAGGRPGGAGGLAACRATGVGGADPRRLRAGRRLPRRPLPGGAGSAADCGPGGP